jgi:hypothetical protein
MILLAAFILLTLLSVFQICPIQTQFYILHCWKSNIFAQGAAATPSQRMTDFHFTGPSASARQPTHSNGELFTQWHQTVPFGLTGRPFTGRKRCIDKGLKTYFFGHKIRIING